MEKFYGMSNDYAFKAVMQKREDVLINLISALLGIEEDDITTCEITNPISLGESIGDKECILDIKLVLNENKNINIELQIKKEEFWPERSLLYWARTFDDLKAGEDYGLLKPTYHIGIIDFPLYDGDKDLYSEYKIMNVSNHRVYTDKFAIKVLNLRNINSLGETDKRVVHWAKIFKAKTIKELEELAGEQEVYKEMVLTLRQLSEDEKIKQQMEARADYDSRIATAEGSGYRRGREEGRERELLSIVERNLKRGCTIEEIADFTGESVEKINKIINR